MPTLGHSITASVMAEIAKREANFDSSMTALDRMEFAIAARLRADMDREFAAKATDDEERDFWLTMAERADQKAIEWEQSI